MQGAGMSDKDRESRVALAEPVSLDRKQLEMAAGIKFRDPDALEILSYVVDIYRGHDREVRAGSGNLHRTISGVSA